MRSAPVADPIKKFCSKFTHSFFKLDRFSSLGKIVHNNEREYLTKRMRKLTPESFTVLALD